MKQRYLIVLVGSLLIMSLRLAAQPAETTYLGSIAKIGSANNSIFGPFNIGFNFTFFGNVYSQFFINSNGQLNFGTGSDYPANSTIPDAVDPDNYIAPFWDDLTIDASGNILYTTIGASPNRKLIVQFRNMGFYGGPVYMGTFSVILYEGSGVIQTQYRILVLESLARAHGESATIGLENSNGSAGALYRYNDPAAIISRQAISFTPSGGNYTIEPNAVYDGVYLTRNLTLPEPGITPLLSPAEDATIGTSHTFEWSASSNAASYSLKLSTNSSLSGATSYNAGSELSYDISGLVPGTTYYWSVFASNATGLTWGEVKKFTVSLSPPLAAVPQTVFVEQSDDKTIKLGYTGGDAGAKTAIITSLPTQGQLYQYNAGVRGASISTVPATVTDAGRNIIYAATGTSGNGVGNFNYRMNDGTGDSPIVLITVNVSPPGIPNLLYAAKSTTIELQFDRPMADPAGKESEFTVTVDGTPVTVSSLSLKEGDSYSIIVTLSTPLAGGESVFISYSAGTVASAQGGWLASFTDQSVTLSAQTITFSQDLNKKYNDPPFTLTASAPGGSLTYSSSNQSIVTISGSLATLKGVGSAEVTARQAGNASYAPANYTRTLTVAKGDQTITFDPLPDKTYGDSDFTLTALASSALQVTYLSGNTDVATVSGSTVHIVGAGTTVITSSQAGNTLWNPAADVQQELTVNKADQTITFNPLPDKTYGDSDFTLTAVASSALQVTYLSGNTDVATISGSTVHIVGAGTTVITASQAGNDNFNAAADVQQTLTVNKADQTITFEALLDKTFGTPDYNLFATANSGLAVTFVSSNTAVATVTGDLVHIAGVGTTIITASQAGSSNYNAAPDVPQTLNVYTANATITLGNLTTTYNGLAQAATATTTPSGLSYDITYDGSSTPPVNAGSYTVAASITDGSYHGSASGTMTINKAPLTASADDKSRAYGEENPPLTISYTGFVASDDEDDIDTKPLAECAALPGSDVGTYPVTVSGGEDNNYSFTYVDGILTILKADQTIIFSSLPVKTFGDDDFFAVATATSGLAVTYTSSNTAVAGITDGLIHIAGAGTTIITASQAGNALWNPAADVQQELTVNKARLTFTADNKSRSYGEENPLLTYTISGFVNSETDAVLDQLPAIETTALESSPAGEYPITLSGGSDNCYTYIYIPGVLTITSISQVISFDEVPSELLAGDTYTLAASSTSGLEVLFESLDNSIATITGNQLTGVSRGVVQIRAYNEGDLNYDPAETLTSIFINTTHKEVMHLFTPNNDGFNDYWELPEMATWGKCNVKVFNRWGKLVFSDPDYNIPWNGTSNGNPVPEGPYYFIIKTENEGTVKGTVNVVR